MSWLLRIARRVHALFCRKQLDAEMSEEMRLHLELQTQANLARGLPPDEARYAARRQFGGEEQLKEIVRDQRGLLWVEQLRQDLRYAARQIVRAPGFTFVAVVTLALGIGANSTVFGFVRHMALEPLLQQRQSRLVALYTAKAGPQADFRGFSYAEFVALREMPDVFSPVAATIFETGAVGRDDAVKRSLICLVSENYFSLLGVRPLDGRFFSTEEARANAGLPVVVANYALWRRLGFPANFVGSQLQVNGHAFTVIGIAPKGFGGLHSSIGPDVWLPLGALRQAFVRADDLNDARTVRLELSASLPNGLSLAAARTRLPAVAQRLDALTADSAPRQLVLTPPPRFTLGSHSPPNESFLVSFAALALGMSAIVLVIACLNLANLLLARGASRQKEIAVRLSLGATRGRVVRQLLVEALLLSVMGGGFGLLVSTGTGVWLGRYAASVFQESAFAFNVANGNRFDGFTLVVTGLLCLTATLVFGLVPALRATRINLVDDLKRHPGEPAATGAWNRFFSLRHCLLMAQVALALALVFSAGLFVRGARNAMDRDPGFRTAGELVFNLDYGFDGLSVTPIARRQEALLAHALNTPGVARAALASSIPYNFDLRGVRVLAAGASSAPGPGDKRTTAGIQAGETAVSRGYFDTLGIPILRGRDFTAAENQPGSLPLVGLVDEQLARALFGDAEAVGHQIVIPGIDCDPASPAREIEIVGVMRSPRNDVWETKAPRRLYRPLGQVRRPDTYLHVQVAASASLPAVLDRLRRGLRELDPETPVLLAKPLADFVEKNINLLLPRLAAVAFGVFSAVSLVLAVVGVYGVKAHAVARRSREIGIRLALGARPAQVTGLILRQGLLQTGVGVVGGIVFALLAGQTLSKMLYGVSAVDPLALSVATVLIGIATVVACLIPARRASKVDPVVALRCE